MVLIHVQLLNREFVMENEFLDKVEDNAAIRIWLEKTQQEKDDSLTEGYTSELWDFIRISVTRNNLQELKEMWDNGMTKPSNYSTKTMVICLIYSMSKWISTYFELLPSIGISPIAASLLGRSLSAYRRVGEERFIGYAQLLLAWFYSHFLKVENVSYRIFFENYSLLKEFVATLMRDNISEEKWMTILQGL
ncbi:hypothetical protein Goklo_028409 [Gossypium klotzschianum]|uniref:Aminotransferase-like plant mobile domain-containing protein n=1 Tax=Gossypium klotzschianum TaxID=34286 RepID=A0A7J8U1I0_9ROSI|nr:hypothetical protein [Gossypium klotzschianum]